MGKKEYLSKGMRCAAQHARMGPGRKGDDRMAGYDSKLCVAEAFASLVQTMPLERVTVGMVAERIGKHRKTFYYHFSDRGEVITWLFRYDLAQGLKALFDDGLLVCEPAGEGAYPTLPFYVRNMQSDGRLYNAPFFDELSRTLERRRAYYRAVLSVRGPGSLEEYLYRLYRPQIKQDIMLLIERRLADEGPLERAVEQELLSGGSNVDFLAEFFTGAFIQRMVKRLLDEPCQRSLEEVRPYENIVHDSLALLIERSVNSRRQTGGWTKGGQPGSPPFAAE